ncbi:MAG: DNA replication/repair protein RecF [Clostridia bacterium]|nr:DNA replication/repair protein RecF [Clostridia bacterium]
MIVKSLNLINFRNYRRLNLDVGPSVNIIYGFNAQGKTNIIEAINVCSCLASHRTAKEKELITLNENEFEISMELFDPYDNSDTSLYYAYYTENSSLNKSSAPKRVIKQDSIQINKIANYMGICNTVIFAPEDLNLIKGSPSIRRKFFNLLISKVSPSYFGLISNYSRLLAQKNSTIKSFKGNTPNDMALDYWDYPLADVSAEIILYRYRYSKLLSISASKHHSNISDNKEELDISLSTISGSVDVINNFFKENDYLTSFIEGKAPEAIYARIKGILSEYLYSKFKSTRQMDCERGITGIGVHRDDIDILLNGLNMKSFSSQGQQRSAALSLKLAELDIISSTCKTAPILLLDDVFSELDQNRRVSLLSGMVNAQIFITCTERKYIENELKELISDKSDIRYFHVEKGIVTPED